MTISISTFETLDGIAAPAVSAAGTCRIYFDSGDNQLKLSENAGAYVSFADVASGGWTDDGTVVRLTTATDQVGMGTTAPLAGSKLNLLIDDANNAALTDVFVVDHTTSGVPGAGIASAALFRCEDSVGATVNAGRVSASLTDVTAATVTSSLIFYTRTGGAALAANATLTGAGQLQVPTTGSTGGLLVGGDAQWFRGAADRMDLASGDSLNIVLGNLQMAGTTLFESDRDLAVSLLPNADNTLNLGSASVRFASAFAVTFDVRAAAGDAVASTTVADQAIRMGAGGAGALDLRMRRTAAATLTIDNNGAGAATVVPATDDTGVIGTDALRWNRVRATNVVSGAYWEEELFADEFSSLADKLATLEQELVQNENGLRHLARIVMLTARSVLDIAAK